MTVGGKWVERIIDLPDPQVEAVMVRLPAGADALELVKFHAPGAESSTDSAPPNRLGMRHLAFRVDDLHGVVDYMRTAGWDTVGEIVDYDGVFLLCTSVDPMDSSSSSPSSCGELARPDSA
jgi:catechol 2,3-dioxygenase-like lactoylglutathione lyase family enzyme